MIVAFAILLGPLSMDPSADIPSVPNLTSTVTARHACGSLVGLLVQAGMSADSVDRLLGRPSSVFTAMTGGGPAVEWRSYPQFGLSIFLRGDGETQEISQVVFLRQITADAVVDLEDEVRKEAKR